MEIIKGTFFKLVPEDVTFSSELCASSLPVLWVSYCQPKIQTLHSDISISTKTAIFGPRTKNKPVNESKGRFPKQPLRGEQTQKSAMRIVYNDVSNGLEQFYPSLVLLKVDVNHNWRTFSLLKHSVSQTIDMFCFLIKYSFDHFSSSVTYQCCWSLVVSL